LVFLSFGEQKGGTVVGGLFPKTRDIGSGFRAMRVVRLVAVSGWEGGLEVHLDRAIWEDRVCAKGVGIEGKRKFGCRASVFFWWNSGKG